MSEGDTIMETTTKQVIALLVLVIFLGVPIFYLWNNTVPTKNEARNPAPLQFSLSSAPPNPPAPRLPIAPKTEQMPNNPKTNMPVSAIEQHAVTTSPKWGFYVNSWEPKKILALEQTLGKSPDMIAVFVHFGNENKFPTNLAPITKDRGKTLVIFWEATDYTVGSAEQPKFSYDAILRGDWDAYMKSFASDAKTYGAPVILVPFSEMNGNWFPWSGTENGNTPAKAILAYRHVHDLFAGVSNVKFGFAPNSDSVPDTPENSLDKYYPGDAYVDIVGVDGFNASSTCQTFDEIFAAPLAILATYDKPIYIFSFATGGGASKATWITDTFTKTIPKYPKIAGWIWFNENKEEDWRIDSDPNSLAAFKAILP